MSDGKFVRVWVNPKYADLVDFIEEVRVPRGDEMAKCGNCQGVGRIIIQDKNGKKHSVTCGNCQGSGQK